MVMETIQIRLTKRMVNDIDKMVKEGRYSSRSDAVRDSVRKTTFDEALDNVTGSIPDSSDSVKEVREIRRKLSKEKLDIDDINNEINVFRSR